MENILITGGAGFIGSSLAEKLLELGNKIIVIDNFNDNYDPEIKKRNIQDVKESIAKLGMDKNELILYREDIRDKEAAARAFRAFKIDRVIHLAAIPGVRASVENPERTLDVNINGTLNILECCRKYGIKKLIFASSSSVYGNNTKVPFEERDMADNPISPYAVSKKAGELLCHTYHHLCGMNVVCLRFFTVYGPRQRPDLAIHKFAKLIMEGKPIPYFGSGTAARDYTHIEDIVEGIVKASEFLDTERKAYEIINLGSAKPVSLKEMVEVLEEAIGISVEFNMLSVQPGDVEKTFANINKAKVMLGYSPSKNLREGIKTFVEWLRNKAEAGGTI